MKPAAPALAPLLRSDVEGDLLAALLLNAGQEFTLSELARSINVAVSQVHYEINRLSTMGVVIERRIGSSRLVQANTSHPLGPALTELMELTYGAPVVLAHELAAVTGVDQVFIYGSWAARRAGQQGPPPSDVDVLVIGDVSRADLHAAADRSEKKLRRAVNIQRVSVTDWLDGGSAFVRQLQANPLFEVKLEGNR